MLEHDRLITCNLFLSGWEDDRRFAFYRQANVTKSSRRVNTRLAFFLKGRQIMEKSAILQEGVTQEAIQKQYTDADGPFVIHVVRLYPTQDGYRERIDRMDVLPNTVADANLFITALEFWGEEDKARGVYGGRYVTAFYEPFQCPRPWTRNLLGSFQREMIRQAIEAAEKTVEKQPELVQLNPEYVRMRLDTVNELMGWRSQP